MRHQAEALDELARSPQAEEVAPVLWCSRNECDRPAHEFVLLLPKIQCGVRTVPPEPALALIKHRGCRCKVYVPQAVLTPSLLAAMAKE